MIKKWRSTHSLTDIREFHPNPLKTHETGPLDLEPLPKTEKLNSDKA